jgi:hypothetical protein
MFKALERKFIDPEFAKAFHKWATILWFVAAFPICIFLSTSLPFIVFISVYAVVVAHWGAFQAAVADSDAKED